MFDKGAIMRRAWEIYRTVRYECERRALAEGLMPARFANALLGAWADAKSATAKPRTADQIRARIQEIECSANFLTKASWAEIQSLRSELRGCSDGSPIARSVESEIRGAIVARIGEMREGRWSGLTRENWKELGALRDKLCNELSANV